MTFSISTWVPLTASAVTARPHGLHSNVSSGNSAWNAVRASCIVSPQHGQATYWYSRIFESPYPHPPSGGDCIQKISHFSAGISPPFFEETYFSTPPPFPLLSLSPPGRARMIDHAHKITT